MIFVILIKILVILLEILVVNDKEFNDISEIDKDIDDWIGEYVPY